MLQYGKAKSLDRSNVNKLDFMKLWDLYGGLLTPTQQEVTNLYLNLDLTVSEIAEAKGITRQGVSDCLSSCKKQFEEWENKIGYAQTADRLALSYSLLKQSVDGWADGFLQAHPEYAREIEGLKSLSDKDYAEEAARLFDKGE